MNKKEEKGGKRGKSHFQKENRKVKQSEVIDEEQYAERGPLTGSK